MRVHQCRVGFLLLALSWVGPLSFALDPAKKITQYGHEVWQREQGLIQNSVRAIAQSPDGYLWLGTDEGLARFDGVSFRVFDRGNTPGIGNNSITALLVDRQGGLWIGAINGGLCRMTQGRFEAFSREEGLPRYGVSCLLEARDGSLWVGTAGGLSHWVNGKFQTYGTQEGLPSARILALAQDRSGQVLIGTARGLAILEGGKFRPHPSAGFPDQSVQALCEDGDGGVWVGTTGGLWRIKEGRASFSGAKAGYGIYALRIDRRGCLWVGSRKGGLRRYSGSRFEAYSRDEGLSDDTVLSLFEDREGSLWIGTSSGGLNRLRDTSFVTTSTREGLSADPAAAILEDREGVIWAGTAEGGGLNRLHHGKPTVLRRKDGLLSDVVLSLAEGADGSLWIGTDRGLSRFRAGRLTHTTTKQGLLGDYINSLLTGVDGSLWIGSSLGGLNRLKDGKLSSYSVAEGLPDVSVYCLLETRDGSLWMGTRRGLGRLKDGMMTTPVTEEALSGDTVLALREDTDGSLWIGSRGGGLKRLKDGKLTSITTKEGLFDDTVFQILDDGLGTFWMSCNKGIFRAVKRELAEVADGTLRTLHCSTFGVPDGMGSAECQGGFQPAGWRARDGRLWFPTIKGLAVVDPTKLTTNPFPPPVHIEAMLVDQIAGPLANPFRIAAGARSLEIHYTALSFLVPERVRFKYRLEGFEKGWVEAGTRRTAYYTGLPPGDYRFQVQACNNDGVWNEVGASIALMVSPHFYQTWWFICLYLGAAGASGWALYRWRVRELKLKNEVLAERNQLAMDLHDHLSQLLTGMQLQLSTAREALEQVPGTETCRQNLDRITQLGREGLEETRRTLRGLRFEVSEASDLTDILWRATRPLVEGTEILVSTEQSGDPFPLSTEGRHELFRMGQEAITNAIRHGRALHIHVILMFEPEGVRLTVRDDGEGFNTENHGLGRHPGMGLGGMAARMASLGGELRIRSRPGEGTIVEGFLPRGESS